MASRTRAAAKKSKGKGSSSAADFSSLPGNFSEFEASDCTDANLEALVADGVLPPQSLILWRAPKADELPIVGADQQIVFRSFFERGFGLPCCSFFRGFLFFFGLELINLNPNSILHISIFIHLCEAFLGVRPH